MNSSPLVFHGSPIHRINIVRLRRNIRTTKIGDKTVTIFDQNSFHASPYQWIALAYMYRTLPGHSMAVDLYGNKSQVLIIGPNNLDESLYQLYKRGGYLHSFNASEFWWCEGLGNREVITNKNISPVEVAFITNPVARMLQTGVEFIFSKQGRK